MSLVYITHHTENIYDVERPVGKERESEVRAARLLNPPRKTLSPTTEYGRWLRAKLKEEYDKPQVITLGESQVMLTTSKKCRHRTMGCAKTPIDPPCAFLRKNQGIKWRRENDHVCPKSKPMPPIPHSVKKREEGEKVNFVAKNIEKVITAPAKRPPPRYVDTPAGTRHNLINSGLIPQFICRRDFGKVPDYLSKQKQYINEVRARCVEEEKHLVETCKVFDSAETAGIEVGKLAGVRKMESTERSEILDGLKQHLSELTKSYQSMSLQSDSVAKRQRKGYLESELRQVEQDILLMEQSPIIYISQY